MRTPVRLTQTRWFGLLKELAKGRPEAINIDTETLNLSKCLRSSMKKGGGLRSDGTFDPVINGSFLGKDRIRNLILPDAATAIVDGTEGCSVSPFCAFKNFRYLYEVTGRNIIRIGDHAFCDCPALSIVDFPKAEFIGEAAFCACQLHKMNLPNIAKIDNAAFAGSDYPTKTLVITLGKKAPVVGCNLFADCNPRTVIVQIPKDAQGFGTSPSDSNSKNWGNAFRGMGWNGKSFGKGKVNTNITLKIKVLI